MKYLAHREKEREQLLLDHLTGTAEKAKKFAEVFGKGDWGYCCGMLHDLGKYSDKFQRRIRGEEIKVDHATAGARVCLELGGMYPFMEYCIAGHHAGLPDMGGKDDAGNSPTLNGRRKKKIEDFQAYKNEVCIPELKTVPIDINKTTNAEFSLGMFMRMLYSCLVDADFLDTEEFMANGNTGRQQGENMPQLLEKLEKYIARWIENKEIESVNGRRTEILRACLDAGEKEKGLFRLTVPTGGGKTIASLAFALRHAVKHHMDRIIYVIPYTSIIEQNAGVFREILGNQNVLENHCNVDYESKKKICEELKGGLCNFARVGKEFRLIEKNTKTIFINIEEEAQEILQNLKVRGFTRSGMRRAAQYCVTVYDQKFDKYNGMGMLRPVSEDIQDFYVLTDLEQYSEETGLNLDIDDGMALWG